MSINVGDRVRLRDGLAPLRYQDFRRQVGAVVSIEEDGGVRVGFAPVYVPDDMVVAARDLGIITRFESGELELAQPSASAATGADGKASGPFSRTLQALLSLCLAFLSQMKGSPVTELPSWLQEIW